MVKEVVRMRAQMQINMASSDVDGDVVIDCGGRNHSGGCSGDDHGDRGSEGGDRDDGDDGGDEDKNSNGGDGEDGRLRP